MAREIDIRHYLGMDTDALTLRRVSKQLGERFLFIPLGEGRIEVAAVDYDDVVAVLRAAAEQAGG